MMITRRTAIVATAFALVAVQTASAQRSRSTSASTDNRYELGMDAALSFVDGNAVFQLPAQSVRFGFPITPTIELEPAVGLITGGGSTILNLDVGVPFNVSETTGGSDIFLRPVFGIEHFSAGGNSDTQSSLGVGAGIRIPVVPHLAARFEARYRRWFGNNGFNQVDILGGVSILMP